MSDPLLSVEDLRVSFRTDDGIVHAVDGISYTVEEGKTLGIVGESGSGKTVSSLTTLGLTRANNSQIDGRIMFDGQDLVALSDEKLRTIRGNDVAMIFQDPLSALHPFYKVGRATRRGDAGAPQHLQEGGPRAGGRAAGAGRDPGPQAPRRSVSARVLGRHAPASDDRDGARRTSPSC